MNQQNIRARIIAVRSLCCCIVITVEKCSPVLQLPPEDEVGTFCSFM